MTCEGDHSEAIFFNWTGGTFKSGDDNILYIIPMFFKKRFSHYISEALPYFAIFKAE